MEYCVTIKKNEEILYILIGPMPEAHFSMERAKHKVACYIKRQGKGHMDGCNSWCAHRQSLEGSEKTTPLMGLIASLRTRSYFSLRIQYMLFILGMSKHVTVLVIQIFQIFN